MEFNRTSWQKVTRTVGGVALLILLGIAGVLGKDIAKHLSRGTSSSSKENRVTHWTTQELDDLRLESPFVFELDLTVADQVPDNVRDKIVSHRAYKTKNLVKGADVRLSKVTYSPGVALNVEGAAKSSIESIARSLGDPSPVVAIKPIDNKNYEEFVGSYRRVFSGKAIHINSLAVKRGQTIWNIQLIYDDSGFSGEESGRLLSSVKIRHDGD